MKNKFLTHRFLPILGAFLFVVFIFCTNVKATSDTKTVVYNDTTYILPADCPDNFFIVNVVPYNETRLYFPENSSYTDFIAVFQKDADTVLVMYDNKDMTNRINLKWYSITLNSTDFTNGKVNTSTWSSFGTAFNGDTSFIYTTNDIYKSTSNFKPSDINDVFFQPTPAPVLVGIMAQEKVEKKTIQEILGVLPLILVVVVSFLGLRKALNWLLTLLRRS